MRIIRFDRWGEQLGTVLGVTSGKFHDALGETDTLELECSSEVAKGDRLLWADYRGQWHEHMVDEVAYARDGERVCYRATCDNSLNETYGDYVEDRRPSGSAADLLGAALDTTRWEVGDVPDLGTHSTTYYHVSAREAVQACQDECGGELSTTVEVGPLGVTARKVNLSRRGANRGRRFTYRRDMTSITRTVQSGEVCTAMYGYGKGVETDAGGYGRKLTFGDINGGKDYVEDLQALEKYGRPDGKGGKAHVFGKVEFSDCEDKSELLRLTDEEFRAQLEPKVCYEATVEEFAAYGYDLAWCEVGDDVLLTDEPMAIRVAGRVTAVDREITDEGKTTLTIGNIIDDLSAIIGSQQDAIDSLNGRAPSWDVAATAPESYINLIIDGLNQSFERGETYKYEFPNKGMIFASVPLDEGGKPTRTPATAMQLAGGGFRIADEVGPDGEFEWRTFGTGSGFTADLITLGTLSDGAGLNYWNLQTGEFHLSSSSASVDGEQIAVKSETMKEVDVEYAQGTSATQAPASGWSTTAPEWEEGKYIWQRTVTTSADGSFKTSDPVCISGRDGKDGIPGPAGSDGESNYFHVKYAPNANPTASQMTETPQEYIGTYVDGNVADSADPKKYTWIKIEGRDGADGIPGKDGADGVTYYLHIAYATSADGTQGFSTTVSAGKTYIGQCVDTTLADPTTPSSYRWSLIKGDKGIGVEEIEEQYYLSTSSTSQAGGSWSTAQPEWAEGKYIWTRSKVTWTDGVVTYTDPVLAKAINGANQAVADLDKELDMEGVFNRLTNNGSVKGIYREDGELYINASYLKAGVITGGASHWNLDTGDLLVEGTVQTSSEGDRVVIDPDFNQVETGGGDRFQGAGIRFPLDGSAVTSPYVATESSSYNEGEVSALVINGGRRASDDPSAFARMGMRKSDGGVKYGIAELFANKTYSSGNADDNAQIRAVSGKDGVDTQAYLWANGGDLQSIGVQANADKGYLYLGGYLGTFTGAGTLACYYWDNPLTISAFQNSLFTVTLSSPARSGKYRPFATVDAAGSEAYMIATVGNASASGWSVYVKSFPRAVSGPNGSGYYLFPEGSFQYLLNTIGVLTK